MNWERSMRGARYHEAGHAVAAYRNGYTITGVKATDEEWRTDWRRPAFGGYADVWREACVTLAGQFADHVAAWEEMRPEPWVEFLEAAQTMREMVEYGEEDERGDHLYILEHLEEMVSYPSGHSLEACYGWVVEDTRQLLWDHWSEVEDRADLPIVHYAYSSADAEQRWTWDKRTYRPWERVPDPPDEVPLASKALIRVLNEWVEMQEHQICLQ